MLGLALVLASAPRGIARHPTHTLRLSSVRALLRDSSTTPSPQQQTQGDASPSTTEKHRYFCLCVFDVHETLRVVAGGDQDSPAKEATQPIKSCKVGMKVMVGMMASIVCVRYLACTSFNILEGDRGAQIS